MKLNHAFGLFGLARQAYERTANADSDLAPYQTDAIAAVLFSVATLEAFIIELANDAEWTFPEDIPRDQPVFADQLYILLQEAESEHVNLQMKYLIAGTLLPGCPLKKSHRLYQRLILLIQLRNFIIHPKPQRISTQHNIVRRLEQEKVLAEGLGQIRHRAVISRISTKAMARWACYVVTDIVKAFSVAAADQLSLGIGFRAALWPDMFPPVDKPKPNCWPWCPPNNSDDQQVEKSQ